MSETVTVACKLPSGLVLRLFTMVERTELVLGGGTRKVKQAVQTDQQPVTIKGNSVRAGQERQLFGGYALTHNVPKDFFDEWMRQNKDSDVVRNNMIFAHTDRSRVQDEATEKRDIKSGLQPLSQTRDPRAPKKVTPKDAEKEAA